MLAKANRITKRKDLGSVYLNGTKTENISSYLDSEISIREPDKLLDRDSKCFLGHYISGVGFVLTNNEASEIIKSDSRYKNVVFPYLNGQDVNSEIDQRATRCVIYFDEMEMNEAADYQLVFSIVQKKVLPERIKKDLAKYPRMVNEWWKFWMNRKELMKAVKHNKRVLVTARVSKMVAFSFVENNQIFDEKLVVFSSESFSNFSILSSVMHTEWAWKYCTTLESRFNYTPNTIYDTFPFPQNLIEKYEQNLENIGEAYHEFRRLLMLGIQSGLTKIYNLYHSNAIIAKGVNHNDKHIVSLQKHLEKTENTILIVEAISGILKMRELHIKMDETVLNAYQWNDIQLRHDFYEVDYLPENDRIRFTIHPEARKEVLKRLLELNHKIHEEEVAASLLDVKPAKKSKKKETNPSQNELF